MEQSILKLTGKWYLDHYREYFSTNEGILATSSTGSSTLSSDCSPPYKGGFNPSSLKLGEYIVAIGDTTYKMIGLADKCIASWN